nr:aminoglycoside adenylyltransferase family protein [Brucella intermedia]
MQAHNSHDTDQIQATIDALRTVLGDGLAAVYMHGSAVSGGLRPQSDIDLLAVIDRTMSTGQRSELLAALLRISGRHPAKPGAQRCMELLVFCHADLVSNRFPVCTDFVYGEWLRQKFETGDLPMPESDPEFTLLLAQARREAIALLGPNLCQYAPEIPATEIRQAMKEALPSLLSGLIGDERNVLLTLARMWCTAKTGEFVTKDAGAAWAISQMRAPYADTLNYAKKAYLGEVADDWSARHHDAQRLAQYLKAEVAGVLYIEIMG